MQKIQSRINNEKNKKILIQFQNPKTPGQVEKILSLKKIKMKPYLKSGLVTILNPTQRKGKLYVLTEKGSKLLKIKPNNSFPDIDHNIIGWILASPRQRYVVLKTTAIDKIKRTSESIRHRASRENKHLTRISTKEILKELISKNLVKTELHEDRMRYYWISRKGERIFKQINKME